MTRWGPAQLGVTLLFSLALWAALASACLFVGSTGRIVWPADDKVLWIRIDYALVASLVGAALAAAGVVYQAVLRNPLADPYLLGVSSGSMLVGYAWQIGAFSGLFAAGGAAAAFGQQTFAFAGAAISVAVVFTLASRRGRLEPVTLLLVGVIVNAVNASIFLLLNALVKDPARAGGPVSFLVGALPAKLTVPQWWFAGTFVGVGWLVFLFLSGQLNVAGLSEAEAESLGVRIHRLRWIALVVASLVTASAVAVSGPIGFVGLVCPHLARLIVGNDQRRLLPLATALGAGLLATADAASRWVAQSRVETTLPVGVLTGLLGGPFFLLLLWRSRNRGNGGSPGMKAEG
jgi:iron complex transport system permease protein